MELKTHKYGFVALLENGLFCVGGSNKAYDNGAWSTEETCEIRYVKHLFFPEKFYCTYTVTIVQTGDRFIKYKYTDGRSPIHYEKFEFKRTPLFVKYVETMQNIKDMISRGTTILECKTDFGALYLMHGKSDTVIMKSELFPKEDTGRVKAICDNEECIFYIDGNVTKSYFQQLLATLNRIDHKFSDIELICH